MIKPLDFGVPLFKINPVWIRMGYSIIEEHASEMFYAVK